MPLEMFGVMTLFFGMLSTLVLIILQPPPRHYPPVHRKRPPNLSLYASCWHNLKQMLLNVLNFVILHHVNTSLSHHRCFPSYWCQPRCGAFLFSLCLRRKGYHLWHGHGPKLKPSAFPSRLTPLNLCPTPVMPLLLTPALHHMIAWSSTPIPFLS